MVNFIGIDQLSDLNNNRYMFHESISGILGLAPPKNSKEKINNFLYQLHKKGLIDHLTFAIYLQSESKGKSNIKFGSYDKEGLKGDLTMLRTKNTTTWTV